MSLHNELPAGERDKYQPGVYMLTGINGTGKSTIVDMITDGRPETVPLHASIELSRLFNGISREEMECLDAEEKLARMVAHFTVQFERSLNENKAVIIDTHLLVPIRKDGNLSYEDIWAEEYRQYTHSMHMLTAAPETIRGWRLRDEAITGRQRSTRLEDISADQNANVKRFNDLVEEGSLPEGSRVIENIDGGLSEVVDQVEAAFRSS